MVEKRTSDNDFSIPVEMVRHIAFLVRLGIQDEEAQSFSNQFSSIIDYFQQLNMVDTEDIIPACEISSINSVMREDEIHPSMPREDFFKSVPHRQGEFVQVPSVFEE